MRAALDLRRLHDSTSGRISYLRGLLTTIFLLPPAQQSIQLAYIAIELDNLIIGCLRAFTISTLRKAKTTKGKKIAVNTALQDESEIGAYVLSVLNAVKFKKLKSPIRIARTEEPTIRDPKETEKVLTACGASNLPSLQNALSINSRIFRDVKFVRHFYAHRGADTFAKAATHAASMGIFNVRHPDEILRHVVTGRPLSVIEEWLFDAELFFELLME